MNRKLVWFSKVNDDEIVFTSLTLAQLPVKKTATNNNKHWFVREAKDLQ